MQHDIILVIHSILIDIDKCKEGTHDCSNFARCVNLIGGYDCECHAGFEGDGTTCTGMTARTTLPVFSFFFFIIIISDAKYQGST